MELTNAFGTTRINELTIAVTQASPGTPKLTDTVDWLNCLCDGFYTVTQEVPAKPVFSSDNTSGGGSFKVTMKMWSGTNGQTYNLYENGVLIYTQPLGFKIPAAQSAVEVIANRPIGTYQYRGELVNFAVATSSDMITVNVTK